ncbi:MAG: MEDS domain-containing protein [Streptosporangiaceae bacterium]
MRTNGARVSPLRARPHDHLIWTFDGPAGFSALVVPFLAEGSARGEFVMYLADDPDPSVTARLTRTVAADANQVASITEVYGASGIVDARVQRAVFASVLADSLAGGFTGIRVAADNTSLVADDDRRNAWLRWEFAADEFIAGNPVTGLCGYDVSRVGPGVLGHLATMHPLRRAAGPAPAYRIYSDGQALMLVGEPDLIALAKLRIALDAAPGRTGVLVDLAAARSITETTLAGLRGLAESGVEVTIRGTRALIGLLSQSAGDPIANLRFIES